MKRFLPIAFLFIYFVGLVSPAMPVIEYVANKSEIIQKYCKNIDKPALNCEGKCHLAKQLKETNKKEKQDQSLNLNNFFFPVGNVAQVTLVHPTIVLDKSYPELSNERTAQFMSSTFHPPQV